VVGVDLVEWNRVARGVHNLASKADDADLALWHDHDASNTNHD